MCDRDGVKKLAAYLGRDIDDSLLAGQGRPLDIICGSLKAFSKNYSQDTVDVIARAIAATDVTTLPGNGPNEEALAQDVFRRLSLELHPQLERDAYEAEFLKFSITFQRFTRWFRAALDAAMYMKGLKNEVIALDNAGARDHISELKELPSRRLGELNFGYRMHGCAAISKYIESLLNKYGHVISPDNCSNIIGIMNKVSAHPGYFKSMSADQKLVEARPLIVAISELQLYPVKEPAKADLLSALSILLFNVFPAPKLLKFIARFQPSPENDALQYDYNAILAMNFMLAGKLDEASGFNEKALKYAGDEEKRAYTHIMDSCIRLKQGNIDEAVNALYRCSALTRDRRMKATALFYQGIIYYEKGSVPEALESFRSARISLDDELDIMNACNNIGACAMLQGDLKTAIREFENVEYIGRYMSSKAAKFLKSVASSSLGLIYFNMSNYGRAIDFFKDTLRLDRELHDKKGVADQLGNIGLALKAKQDYKTALEYFKAALNISFAEDYLEGTLFSFSRIEQLMALEGRYDEAESFKQEVIRRNPDISKMLRK